MQYSQKPSLRMLIKRSTWCLWHQVLFGIQKAFGLIIKGSSRGFLHHPKDPLKRPAALVSLVMDSPASCPVHVGAISDDWRFAAGGCDRDVRTLRDKKKREMDGSFAPQKDSVIWERLKGVQVPELVSHEGPMGCGWKTLVYEWLQSMTMFDSCLILADKIAGELGMPMMAMGQNNL